LRGKRYEPQEFKQKRLSGDSPADVLSAVAACAVCDALPA